MATTIRLQVGKASELLADVRNAGVPFFEKNVFVFCHRYVAGTDYTATDQITIEFDGALEVLYSSTTEGVTKVNELAHTIPAAISGRTGKYIVTDATNGSSAFVNLFAVVRV